MIQHLLQSVDEERPVSMAVTMDLEERASDSKLNKNSVGKNEFRPNSSVSLSKSDHGLGDSKSSEQLKQYKNWVSTERWNELKKIADTAMNNKKVFMIKGGGYPSVRQALLERGWVEKTESHKIRSTAYPTDPSKLGKKEALTKVERLILFKFMEHHAVDFLWTTKRDKYDWLLANKDVVISRYCRSIFTSKEGLCASLTQMHWYTEPGVANIKFPRCYNIHNSEQMEEFIEDFRLTACISILRWFCILLQEKTEDSLVSHFGKVPFTAIEFALSRVEEYICFCTHKDIDEIDEKDTHIWDHEWDQFLTHHYLLVHEKCRFICSNDHNMRILERKSVKLLGVLARHWPQMDIDGLLNIWIVKPGNKCRGRGIHLMNNIKDISNVINLQSLNKSRYVVQKYIETPLIIYDTKFDIRQWFLITNCQPLTIWVYKDSYLRFSSQIFSLSNYHESVHLTNNAVQSRYKNVGDRDKALPDENMWDCHSFKAYLRQIGKAEMWDSHIYPGIKKCLVSAMLACQDSMDKRQNSFELYGADFMLTEDFTPWLIEINSSPDLTPSTSVTARMCPQCLEDVIKVVLDKRNNPEADTGCFELVYKQTLPKAPAYLGLSLCVTGKKFFNKKKMDRKERPVSPILVPEVSVQTHPEIDHKVPKSYNGPIITDLLSWLHPFDALPTNEDGIVYAKPLQSTAVRHAFTVVKSGLLFKNPRAKRKSSGRLSRQRARAERDPEHKRFMRHSCCQNQTNGNTYRTESAGKSSRRIENSVGNKRCYIDPIEWERETTSVSRPTISFQNRISSTPLPVRQYKPEMYRLVPDGKGSSPEDASTKLSAVGHSIRKLRDRQDMLKADAGPAPSKYRGMCSKYRMVLTPPEGSGPQEAISIKVRKKV